MKPHPATLDDKVVELVDAETETPEQLLMRMARLAARGFINNVIVVGLDGNGSVFAHADSEFKVGEVVYSLECAKLDCISEGRCSTDGELEDGKG